MSLPGLRPKIAILLAAMAAGATTDPAPAAADIFFRPFFGYSARRFVVEAEPGLSPREVVAILAQRGFRLAEPLAYRDDVIIAIGADPRGRLARFVLDADDGEVLERRRLHREPPPAAPPLAARPAPARKRAVETAARPAPIRAREKPATAAPVRPTPHKAAAEPPARPATRSAAPKPPAETTTVPAGKAKAPPAETTKLAPAPPPAPATPPAPPASASVVETAPPSPAAAAPPPEPAAPAAQWKAPSE